MASLTEINQRIRELKAEAHRSNDAYVRLRPQIRKLERMKEAKESESRNG